MKRLLLLLLILCALPCFADERAQGFCMVGGQKSITQGLQSTNDIMASYPQCQVNVYLAGTTTPATIFSDNGVTVLTNPFTANTDASWGFYAANGHYDVVLSGGQAGGFPVPFTLSYIFLNSGGGGSDVTVEVNGVVVPPSVYNFVNGAGISITNPSLGNIQIDSTGAGCQGTSASDNTITNCGFNNLVGNTAPTPANLSVFGNNNFTNNTATQSVGIGNNAQSLSAGTGRDFVSIGDNTLTGNTGTQDVVAIGDFAGSNQGYSEAVLIGNDVADGAVPFLAGGQDLIAIGNAAAVRSSIFEGLIAIGSGAGAYVKQINSSVGADYIAIGDGAGSANVGGAIISPKEVVAIGSGTNSCSGTATSTGESEVVAVGDGAAGCNQGADVVAIGDGALGGRNAVPESLGNTGNDNVAIGDGPLLFNQSGTDNIAIGRNSGTIGWSGNSPGNSNITGNQNVWLGSLTGPNTATQLSNTVALGYQAQVSASNQTVIGNASMTSLKIFGSGNGCLSSTSGVITGSGSGCGGGVTTVNSNPGALQLNFSAGAGSCSLSGGTTTCTITGSSSGGGSVTSFIANSGAWPTWLVPTVTLATTTPTLAVAASAIPNSALANASTTINGVTCTLGSTCSVAAPTFQTNSVSNTAQTGLNFINPSSFNGLSFTYSNPSTNQETFAVGGTLGNAGLTNSTITLGSTSVALGATVSSVTGLNTTGTSGGLTGSPAVTVSSITDTGLTSGNCLQASVGGHIVDTGLPCGSGSGGSGITALTGDVNASGAGSVPAVVKGINGVLMASLTTGLLKNTAGTPSIAVAGTDYVTPTGLGTGLTALNASNLGSGTVPAARLPNPSSTTLGGVQSKALVAHQWIDSISTSGIPTSSGVSFSDIAGTVATAQLPLGTSGAPGALQCGSGTSCSGGVISATGGLSGLTTGFLTKATSGTTIGGSQIDEGITHASAATVSDPNGLYINGTGPTLLAFGGGSVSFTPGSGVTSVTCTSGTCQTARGSISIVGGSATTGTIATITFPLTLAATPVCGASVNGGATYLGIGHGNPTTAGFTITSAVSVSGKTMAIDYWCEG